MRRLWLHCRVQCVWDMLPSLGMEQELMYKVGQRH